MTAPLCTWSGHEEAGRACVVCGAAICDHCARGGDRCATCVRARGTLPWAERRDWLGTMRALLHWRRSSLEGVPREGPLGPSIAFAAIAASVHVVGSAAVNVLVTWWMFAASLDRFGVRDGVGRFVMASDAWDRATGALVATPVGLLALPSALVLAARLFGRTIPLRAAAHAALYLSAWGVVLWIPGLGWLGVVAGITAIHGWLAREAGLAAPRAGVATAIAIGLAMIVDVAALEITAPWRHGVFWAVADLFVP